MGGCEQDVSTWEGLLQGGPGWGGRETNFQRGNSAGQGPQRPSAGQPRKRVMASRDHTTDCARLCGVPTDLYYIGVLTAFASMPYLSLHQIPETK